MESFKNGGMKCSWNEEATAIDREAVINTEVAPGDPELWGKVSLNELTEGGPGHCGHGHEVLEDEGSPRAWLGAQPVGCIEQRTLLLRMGTSGL